MSTDQEDFKEQYRLHPVRIQAITDFKRATNFTVEENTRKFMCQLMAIIGLELENRFPSIVRFDDKKFRLFGREKSEKSVSDKKRHNIEAFDKQFLDAIEAGNLDSLPTKVRPIFDYYAFKLVCPEIKDPREVVNIVITDILNDIGRNHPEYLEQISDLQTQNNKYFYGAHEFIRTNCPNEYPGLEKKLTSVLTELELTKKVEHFLSENNSDVSSLTYSNYYSKIIECYNFLMKLCYEESNEEYEAIIAEARKVREKFSEMVENKQSHLLIPEQDQEYYSLKLKQLLNRVNLKKSNKLDLALGDLMIWDILMTSDALKKLQVQISTDPTRNKQKRNPNGYIANFYSLDLPNNLMSEIQIQSTYRYAYGESGPAAHNKMPNGEKKRTFIEQPEDGSEYEEWAKLQFTSLPKYFKYLGHGFIQVFSTLENFERYYNTEDPEKVKEYVRFIAEHDVNLLNDKIMIFYLDDEPIQLDSIPEHDDTIPLEASEQFGYDDSDSR